MMQVPQLEIPFGLVSEELATQLNNSQSKIIITDENLIPVASAASEQAPCVQIRSPVFDLVCVLVR